MSLVLPVVGTTAAPTWATLLLSALQTIDTHDHTSGKGVQVPVSGINFDTTVNLNNQDLTGVASITATDITADSGTFSSTATSGSAGERVMRNNVFAKASVSNATTAAALVSGAQYNCSAVSQAAGTGYLDFTVSSFTYGTPYVSLSAHTSGPYVTCCYKTSSTNVRVETRDTSNNLVDLPDAITLNMILIGG